jgi:molybdopterin synthase catalytic subunit
MACVWVPERVYSYIDRYGDGLKQYPHAVEVTDQRINFTAERFQSWLADDDHVGACMLFHGDLRQDTPHRSTRRVFLGFTDPNMAFAFKMMLGMF